MKAGLSVLSLGTFLKVGGESDRSTSAGFGGFISDVGCKGQE